MCRWPTTVHENGVQRTGWSKRASLRDTSIRGWRLLEGRSNSVTTEIPLMRLARVGKGTTLCRTWKHSGRTHSSVCKRPATQQSPPMEALCKLWWNVVVD